MSDGNFYYEGLPRYITSLEGWFREHQLNAYYSAILPDGRWRLFLGVIAWGGYVDHFINLTIPSLLAPGNIEALFDPTIMVHVDAANRDKIATALERLRPFAQIRIEIIPDDILAMVPDKPENKYWLLGTAHNLHMQQAKYSAHGYHMLMPDHIYGRGYFENLARLAKSHRGIVQGAMSAVLEDIAPVLRGENCSIEPRRLNSLALDHLHDQLRPMVMNDRDDYPSCALLMFVGERAAEIVSPHMSLVYLSFDLLMRATPRLVNTIDGQLPFFIPDDVEPYVPVPADGMSYIEVSTRGKPYQRHHGYSIEQFCIGYCVMAYNTKAFQRFSNLTTVMEFEPGYVPAIAPMANDDIEAKKAEMRNAVANSWDMIMSVLPETFQTDPLIRINREAQQKLEKVT